jgi:hypothetical protein
MLPPCGGGVLALVRTVTLKHQTKRAPQQNGTAFGRRSPRILVRNNFKLRLSASHLFLKTDDGRAEVVHGAAPDPQLAGHAPLRINQIELSDMCPATVCVNDSTIQRKGTSKSLRAHRSLCAGLHFAQTHKYIHKYVGWAVCRPAVRCWLKAAITVDLVFWPSPPVCTLSFVPSRRRLFIMAKKKGKSKPKGPPNPKLKSTPRRHQQPSRPTPENYNEGTALAPSLPCSLCAS